MGKRPATGDEPLDQSMKSPSPDEPSGLRAKRQAEIKLQLLKQRYEEELSSFSEIRVDNILKNSGAREYLERLKTRLTLKEDIIKSLKEDLEFKTKEVAELQDRCREAEKQSNEYLKAWKNAKIERQVFNISSASSIHQSSTLEQYSVPPPPPVEAPSIEEIFRMGPSNRFVGMDSSIPPPPEIDVSLEEILDSSKRSFEQEKGQFLCQAYLSIDLESSQEALSDIVKLVESRMQGWTAFETSDFHVTLIRGHRTIHYHQIKPLLSTIEDLSKQLRPSNLCLDTIRLLSNNEKTRQFLAITTRNNQSSRELSEFAALKRKLRDIVDQFADRATEEDETGDTIPHCSIMYRDTPQEQNEDDIKEIQNLCNEYICLVKVDKINLKIGKEVYSFEF